MLKDKFILTITNGYSKEFDHYPIDHEIIEFIKQKYPNGIGFHPINEGSKILRQIPLATTYNIESKVEKVMVYVNGETN